MFKYWQRWKLSGLLKRFNHFEKFPGFSWIENHFIFSDLCWLTVHIIVSPQELMTFIGELCYILHFIRRPNPSLTRPPSWFTDILFLHSRVSIWNRNSLNYPNNQFQNVPFAYESQNTFMLHFGTERWCKKNIHWRTLTALLMTISLGLKLLLPHCYRFITIPCGYRHRYCFSWLLKLYNPFSGLDIASKLYTKSDSAYCDRFSHTGLISDG